MSTPQADVICTNIAALNVTGLTIKDLDAIPEEVHPRDCPVLYPSPDSLVSNFQVVRDSFGAPAVARKTITYNLAYVYLYESIDSGRGLFDLYQGMVQGMMALFDSIIANDDLAGAVDVTPAGTLHFGKVTDVSGHEFHGCIFLLAVQEFYN